MFINFQICASDNQWHGSVINYHDGYRYFYLSKIAGMRFFIFELIIIITAVIYCCNGKIMAKSVLSTVLVS